MSKSTFLFSLLKKAIVGVSLLSFSLVAMGARLTMDAGQSKTIRTKAPIDAVFAPAPNIADYEIIDDYTFVIYATGEGRTEVTAFDNNGTPLSTNEITVNTLLNDVSPSSNASSQIKKTLTNSNVSIEKVGKAYVIKGKAPTAMEQENVNRIVGEAMGSGKSVSKAKLKYSDQEDLSFLDKVEYAGVVNNVDTPSPPQINVKLSVVEVNKDLSESLGINWANIKGSVIGGFYNTAQGLVTAPQSAMGGFVGINARTFSAFIDAINTQSNARVLAEPNMSMLSGETADLLVGGEVPFVTQGRDQATVTYKEYGIKMSVGAKVMKNNRIRMALAQEVSSIAGQYKYQEGTIPIFKTRRSKSIVELNNGESFILGGLLSSDDIEGLSKVPVLGDVPMLGALFRNASTSRTKSELVIVATVTFTNPVNQHQIAYPNFQRTANLQRFFNLDPVTKPSAKKKVATFLEQGGFIQ
ncbi:hypothetical protein BMT54_07620 [Pasteurellaceae bacterium 15-036681]|nr:hypothetical protein BMT54_07620 [Pasteurellaceae bacterium 15-036681]